MGRKQEERGGACCCCAVREGMLCERSCRGEGEKTLSEADCAGKMFAAAGNLPRLRPAGGGRFFPAGGGTRWKTACRGGAQKRDTFRPGASGTCCFEKCGEAGSLPDGGVTAVACLPAGAGDPPGDPERPVPPGGEGCFEHLKGAIRRPACIRPDASAASCAEPPDAGRKKRPPACRRPEMTL